MAGEREKPMTRRTGGFTLVELMVSMSLFLVLGTALVALLSIPAIFVLPKAPKEI